LTESGATVRRLDGGLIKDNGDIICLAHPFVENRPGSERAAALANGKDTVAIDILLVLRALPIASNLALSAANVDHSTGFR
jgi:hypothetical protein